MAGRILVNALEGFKHHVKLANARKFLFAAFGAGDALFFDIISHLLMAPAVGMHIKAVGMGIVLNQLVRAKPRLATFAVHKRVVKIHNVPGSHPDLGIHENGSVHTHIIRAFLNEFSPPCLFYIILELHTQRTIIPGVG
ncbi:hypothetical protein SDC9_111009 [bioreactor metagenome]|uniref:Uncharacterized protein n=1 Tax=bioreactor metagenome TaxID=1076179 RepID=A0A645BLJ4_9ZZZZ